MNRVTIILFKKEWLWLNYVMFVRHSPLNHPSWFAIKRSLPRFRFPSFEIPSFLFFFFFRRLIATTPHQTHIQTSLNRRSLEGRRVALHSLVLQYLLIWGNRETFQIVWSSRMERSKAVSIILINFEISNIKRRLFGLVLNEIVHHIFTRWFVWNASP